MEAAYSKQEDEVKKCKKTNDEAVTIATRKGAEERKRTAEVILNVHVVSARVDVRNAAQKCLTKITGTFEDRFEREIRQLRSQRLHLIPDLVSAAQVIGERSQELIRTIYSPLCEFFAKKSVYKILMLKGEELIQKLPPTSSSNSEEVCRNPF